MKTPANQNPQGIALACALAFTFLSASPVHAASIIWGTPTTISLETDVSTTGSLLYAYNFGNTGVPSATVGNVTFVPFAVPHGNTGTVTVGVGTSTEFFSSNILAGSFQAPFSALSVAYQDLLKNGVSTASRNSILALTLGGADRRAELRGAVLVERLKGAHQ